ncbi:hypothetical protein FJY94_01015 [Candidatus Kaiserbacteria bacterium]|nr:hypothetical protein [Candidatus Kaiserbacteria bacterium]
MNNRLINPLTFLTDEEGEILFNENMRLRDLNREELNDELRAIGKLEDNEHGSDDWKRAVLLTHFIDERSKPQS